MRKIKFIELAREPLCPTKSGKQKLNRANRYRFKFLRKSISLYGTHVNRYRFTLFV